jgi:hypothetical protein
MAKRVIDADTITFSSIPRLNAGVNGSDQVLLERADGPTAHPIPPGLLGTKSRVGCARHHRRVWLAQAPQRIETTSSDPVGVQAGVEVICSSECGRCGGRDRGRWKAAYGFSW